LWVADTPKSSLNFTATHYLICYPSPRIPLRTFFLTRTNKLMSQTTYACIQRMPKNPPLQPHFRPRMPAVDKSGWTGRTRRSHARTDPFLNKPPRLTCANAVTTYWSSNPLPFISPSPSILKAYPSWKTTRSRFNPNLSDPKSFPDFSSFSPCRPL
jgi:hypothetical protein